MQVFETPGSVSLQIRLPSGRVVVTTVDEPRTSVDVISTGRRGTDAIEAIEISAEPYRDGHLVTVEYKDRIRWGPIQISWGGDVEVRVTCPPGSNLDFGSGSADIRVDGDLGDVVLDSVESGEVRAQTVSGDARIGVGRGTRVFIDAASLSGDLSSELGLEDETPESEQAGPVVPLHVKTVSGDVQIVHAAETYSA